MYIFRTLLFCFLLRDSFYLVVVTPLPFYFLQLGSTGVGVYYFTGFVIFCYFFGGKRWEIDGSSMFNGSFFSLPSCSFKYCLK